MSGVVLRDCRGFCGELVQAPQRWCDDCNPRLPSGRAGRGTAPLEALRAAVFARDERCVKCGSTAEPEMDHIVPEAAGGSTTLENCQRLCRSCNRKKGARVE